MPKINLTNKEYEYFTVLHRNTERVGKNVWWDCKCKCGKIFTATTTAINKGTRKSCGCMKSSLLSQAHLQDLIGQEFGNLKVLERDYNHPQNGQKIRTYWWCECKCGNVVSIERTHLVNRTKISCGCQQSIGEYNINKLLTENNIKYKTQYTNSELQTKAGGYLKFDFAIVSKDGDIIRLIEFDGPQHTQKTNNYFNTEGIQERDAQKNQYCINNKIPLVRIPYYKRDTIKLEDIMGDRFIQ